MSQKSGQSLPASAGSEEISCISYLRGLAALGVVFFHVRIDLWVGLNAIMAGDKGGSFDRAVAWLSLPTIFMGSGVMLFFVISGFCIHAPYAGPKGKKLDLPEYGVRRLFRIYPPYLAALLFTFAVQAIGYHLGYLKSWQSYNYGMAVPMLQNTFAAQPECNPALWTIPVEVAFYIFFPLVYLGLKRSLVAMMATGLLVSLVAMASSSLTSMVSSFLPFWFTWIAGAALAERYRAGELKSPPAAAILFALAAFGAGFALTWYIRTDNPLSGPGRSVADLLYLVDSFCYGIAFNVLLWWSLANAWFYNLLPRFAHRALLFLGMVSYSLYLFHSPLFRACGWWWVWHFGQKPVNYLLTLPFIFLAIVLAWLMYVLVEAPAHELGRKLAGKIKAQRR